MTAVGEPQTTRTTRTRQSSAAPLSDPQVDTYSVRVGTQTFAGTPDLYATFDYVAARLPTNKAGVIPGERLWIGEYGWGGSQTPEQQEPLTRAYLQRLLNWGRQGIPFVLFWEIYNNEPGRNYCLVDSNHVKVACYDLHQRFINEARLLTARFKERNGRLPTDPGFIVLAKSRSS